MFPVPVQRYALIFLPYSISNRGVSRIASLESMTPPFGSTYQDTIPRMGNASVCVIHGTFVQRKERVRPSDLYDTLVCRDVVVLTIVESLIIRDSAAESWHSY